jgi:hypothetical protein
LPLPLQKHHEAENKVLNLAYFSTTKNTPQTHHVSPAIHHKITTIYHLKNTTFPITPFKNARKTAANPTPGLPKKSQINPKKIAADRHKECPPCLSNESL